MLTAAHLHVGRLRIRWPGSSTAVLRPRCEQIISGIDPPSQLAPSAILVIRRLDERLPAAVLGRRRNVDSWRESVRAALARYHAAAARVRNGDVPADADAVIFADEAEWLACLLLDVARGRVLERWWWCGVRPSVAGTRGQAIVRHLIARRRVAAAAVAHLASWAVLRDVAACIDDADTRTLVSEIGDEHRAPALRTLADTGWRDTRLATRTPPDGITVASPHGHRASGPTRPPLAREAETAVRRSSSDRRAAPWEPYVTVPGTLTVAQQWCVGSLVALHVAPARARTVEFARQCSMWIEAAADSSTAHGSGVARPKQQPSAVGTAPLVSRETSTPPDGRESVSAPEEPGRRESNARETVLNQDGAMAPVFMQVRSHAVDSEYGGVLYLINLLRCRDAFDSDAAPSALVLSCGPWHVLNAIGMAMAGEKADGDPLWPLLSELTPPSEIAALSAVNDWVARVVPRLRCRLAGMLAVPEDDVTSELLRRRANVTITATHVDAVFALADVSLRVRRAGLDADPGWRPEYSRVIRFHYGGA
jgi:hypothetical protein